MLHLRLRQVAPADAQEDAGGGLVQRVRQALACGGRVKGALHRLRVLRGRLLLCQLR